MLVKLKSYKKKLKKNLKNSKKQKNFFFFYRKSIYEQYSNLYIYIISCIPTLLDLLITFCFENCSLQVRFLFHQ